MKRGNGLVFAFSLLIIGVLLVMPFASAFSLVDWIKNLFGKGIQLAPGALVEQDMPYPDTVKFVSATSYNVTYSCKDYDGGIYPEMKSYLEKDVLKMFKVTGDSQLTRATYVDRCMDSFILRDYRCAVNGTFVAVRVDCASGCSAGKCNDAPEPEQRTCVDSDGLNLINYGNVTECTIGSNGAECGIAFDTCIDAVNLSEKYCGSDNSTLSQMVTCEESGCLDGSCNYPSIGCTDTDDPGKIYNDLTVVYPNGQPDTSFDIEDWGLNYDLKGNTAQCGANGQCITADDTCLDANNLKEAYCEKYRPQYGIFYIGYHTKACQYGCYLGKCNTGPQ